MIFKPCCTDFKIIGFYLGKIIIGLGLTLFLPLAVSIFFKEINPALDFFLTMMVAFICGFSLTYVSNTDKDPGWVHGMVIVAISWLAAMFLGALPLYLSGHWLGYLDSCFDAMSGFATTGLTLVQDLDHLSYGHNLWRHWIMFIGGQGIVIVALAFLVKGAAGAFRIYVGEAREEKILPNVISTARFIWLVSMVYLILGTTALAITGKLNGMSLTNAIFHGACIFMAAFDTGGFAPQSQNILYYHSLSYEIITILIMLMGALNFKLHYAVWTGNRKEIWRNIETITLFFTIITTFIITAAGLCQAGIYPEVMAFFRKGFYQLISGHTGTGFQTIYAVQFINDWGQLAMIGIIIAMAIGGASCSTTGAIKTIRIGVIVKGFIEDIKRILLPESAVVIKKFHHIKDVIIDDKQVRLAALITLAYITIYFLGAVIGMFYQHSFLESLFESTSAAANVGLSCGITSPGMPVGLKITYIIQMWAGRLEFIAVFTLIGFIVSLIRGKR